MSWTLTTSGASVLKAGVGANAALIVSGASLIILADQAEQTFCGLTRKDWLTGYSSIDTNLKLMISDAVSSMIANKIIQYDMSGYNSRLEAQIMLDVNYDIWTKIVAQLKEKQNQGFN